MRLDLYKPSLEFQRGASRLKEALWLICDATLVGTWLPGSKWRALLLRLFGAGIGAHPVIKPRVRIKFPWRLQVGNHCWIGEAVWIDNLALVSIGNNCCISQGAYLCTGSHNPDSDGFELVARPISLADQVWICAASNISPGAVLGEGAVVSLGSTFRGRSDAWTIYTGNPAVAVRSRGKPDLSKSSA